ncbi:hypothetical protein ACVK00_003151 [Burkholderia sp. PvR073]|uniref:hypothetical protein n=1 Tax=Burkholderia ambifaria TaxID=152480 RepID=UPI0033932C91
MTTTDKSRADALTESAQFLTDVVTAAGLLSCGRTDKKLATRITEQACELRKRMHLLAASPVEQHEATPADAARMSKAVRDVLAERHRQILHEGMTPDQDDRYTEAELSRAAAAYILSACGFSNAITLDFWPWSTDWWKPTTPRRNLVKAAALIFAEMERIDRDPGDESHHDHLNGGSL